MSGLGDTGLWGQVLPGGPSRSIGFDSTQVIDTILPDLHAASREDLGPWTEAELIEWMDEAVKRLSRTAAVFVQRSTAITTVIGQPTYALPAEHVSTLHVSYAITPLRGANTMELAALDPDYRTTQMTPLRWYEDRVGLQTIGLAPVPDDTQPLPVIYEGLAAPLDAGKQNVLVPAPPPLKAYLGFALLAAAYSHESEMESQDIASHCREQMSLYERALVSYFGEAT